MRFENLLALMFITICIPTTPDAQPTTSPQSDVPSAPFGLSWGLTAEQTQSMGIDLTETDGGKNGVTYTATGLPKSLADLSMVIVSFGFDDRLWRIVAVGKEVSNDPYATTLLKRYQELQNAVSKKYGRPEEHHYQDTEIWKDSDDLLSGIREGRSWHYTNFDETQIWVQVGLRASRSDQGYYVIYFEDMRHRAKVEQDAKAAEEDAL